MLAKVNLGNAGSLNLAILIDAGYTGKYCKIKQIRIDFKKLVSELSNSANLIDAFYYNCMPIVSDPPTTREQSLYTNVQKFHTLLEKHANLKIKLGRLQKVWDPDCKKFEFNQKGVDMQIGVDIVQLSMQKKVDKIILIASDSDFVYSIEKAKEVGVKTVLAYFPKFAINDSLLDAVDEVIEIDDTFLSRIIYHNSH